jgi:GlpG protein
VNFIHAAFNISWIWYLGRSLEEHLGTVNTLIFWIAAAIVTSGCELAVSQDTGIGASGVLYAIFGYQFISRKYVDRFSQLLDRNTIRLLIIWLFVCVALTFTNVLNIGNAAHFSGFGFGCLCGWLIERKQKNRTFFVVATTLLILIFGSLIYAPWSEAWIFTKANNAYESSNFQEAISRYENIPADSEYYPYALYWKAYAKDSSGDPVGATIDLEKLITMDPDGYPRAEVLNELAWTYATSDDPKLQDYPRALKYASEAYESSQEKDPAVIDTLAAAYAANGDFAKAVEWQEKAIQLATSMGENDHLEGFQSRLDLFKRGQPYTGEYPPPTARAANLSRESVGT